MRASAAISLPTHLISLPSYENDYCNTVTGSAKLDFPVCKLFASVLKLALPCPLHYGCLTLTDNYFTGSVSIKTVSEITLLPLIFSRLDLHCYQKFARDKNDHIS